MKWWTPGPWKVGELRTLGMGEQRRVITPENDDARYIVDLSVITMNSQAAKFEANARLIAAAPELYEALDWMAGLFNEATTEGVFADALTRARAALAKARGEA